MHRIWFLIITALVEVGTGLSLLLQPSIPVLLLLGVSLAAPEPVVIARVAGAALLALGVASFLVRNDQPGSTQWGVLIALLVYNIAVATLLAHAGIAFKFAGVALWPAVALHALLAVWCATCLYANPRAPIGDR